MELVAEKYKLTDIGQIPSDWEVIELGKIFKLTSGKTKPAVLFENPVDEISSVHFSIFFTAVCIGRAMPCYKHGDDKCLRPGSFHCRRN